MRPLSLTLLLPAAAAATPVEVHHAGRLVDAFGQPRHGPATLTVHLAPSPTAAPVWSDTFPVTLEDGFYTVVLGSGAPLDTALHLSSPEVWLEIAVDGVVLGPRTRLLAVPRAALADAVASGATALGPLLLGDAPDTWCTAGREGALIYDAATREVKVCQGATGWQALGAAATSAGGDLVLVNGARQWADGTTATACWSYRNPPDPAHQYTGATGDGVYRIDPDGAGGVAPFEVYCDMTTDGGGWTLVDNDATDAATFSSRTIGALTDPTVTGGRLLPAYDWSPDPLLLCRASQFDGTVGWLTLEAGGPIAREYPTALTQTANHDGGWLPRTLNGNTNRGTTSWIYDDGSLLFGSVWIGGPNQPTCACNYMASWSGLGTSSGGTSSTTTCSTWVR